MDNSIDPLSTVLMVYTIPGILLLMAGIIVIVLGYGKEKKALKLAGIVITAIGFQVLAVIGALALYLKFIISLTQ
uniref:hypothetical protein n=1 Tax=uncultured Dysgonomonas sp. TaxID=206096 RepID=UPI0026095FE7|nr:hypothetical protein [uncultured Dysgonomonas sp.]